MLPDTVQCRKCQGTYSRGDYPFCKGNPEDHSRPHGSFAPGDAQRFRPVVVFKDRRGNITYPGNSQQPPPPGMVREEITTTRGVRSLQKHMDLVAKIEHESSQQRIQAEQDRNMKARHERFKETAKKMTPEGQGFAKFAMEMSKRKLAAERAKTYSPGSFIDAFENQKSNVAAQTAFSK